MKNFNKTYALLLLLFVSIFTYGQKTYLDSVYVQISDEMELNLSIYEYSDLWEHMEKDLKSLQSILKVNDDISVAGNYLMNYTPDNLLSIEPVTADKKIIWIDGTQTRYQFNNQCNITSEKYYLQIHFSEPDKLISDSLIFKLKEIIDTTTAIQGRFSTVYNYSFQGNTFIHNEQLDQTTRQMDMISLKGGVGLNVIKNQPVIDISAEVAFMFSKKGILKNQFYLSYNLLFDFIDSSKVNTNGFLNVGYRYNFSKSKNKPNWLGLELGYLVSDNGTLFKENTFKFGINWEVGKYISVSPQLYMSGDMKEVYPALRIGFGF